MAADFLLPFLIYHEDGDGADEGVDVEEESGQEYESEGDVLCHKADE